MGLWGFQGWRNFPLAKLSLAKLSPGEIFPPPVQHLLVDRLLCQSALLVFSKKCCFRSPTFFQLQGLLPLLDASSSDDVLRDALDKVLRITQNIKVVEHAGGTLVVEKVDKRLRPAIGRLEKLQNQAESSVIKIKVPCPPLAIFHPLQSPPPPPETVTFMFF